MRLSFVLLVTVASLLSNCNALSSVQEAANDNINSAVATPSSGRHLRARETKIQGGDEAEIDLNEKPVPERRLLLSAGGTSLLSKFLGKLSKKKPKKIDLGPPGRFHPLRLEKTKSGLRAISRNKN